MVLLTLNLIRYYTNESSFSVLVVLFAPCFVVVVVNLSQSGKVILRCLNR